MDFELRNYEENSESISFDNSESTLTEDNDNSPDSGKIKSKKWLLFSLAASFGILFLSGILIRYIGIPWRIGNVLSVLVYVFRAYGIFTICFFYLTKTREDEKNLGIPLCAISIIQMLINFGYYF